MNQKILFALLIFIFSGCTNWLEVEPLDKIKDETILMDSRGPAALMATIYWDLPIDDFVFNPNATANSPSGSTSYHGYNNRGNSAMTADDGWGLSFYTDDALSPRTNSFYSGMAPYWNYAYQSIRRVNQVISAIQSSSLSDDDKKVYIAEAKFINAYIYFQLARRYGGVCLIKEVQEFTGDVSVLNVPRSTEKETYDYIISECDAAILGLPPVAKDKGRANKWAALALKSRVALHAASLCKYQSKSPIAPSYPAVPAKLAGGMDAADANTYYQICIDASKTIIDQSGKELFGKNPSSPEVAMKNYSTMFQNPDAASSEVIFAKYYVEGGAALRNQGHSMDYYYNPRQTSTSIYTTKFNPSLDLVDLYENYSNDNVRQDGVLATRTDGVESSDYGYLSSKHAKYIRYSNPSAIFANKDARFFASIIAPGSVWKGVPIIIQAGYIQPDGLSKILTDAQITLNGTTYYTYGALDENKFSGFRGINHTLTGFSLRKFLQEDKNVVSSEGLHSNTPFVDMRLAEIYLNYAEATVESGQGNAALAKQYLNALRSRAGHKDNIDATIENIMKERRIELAFEGGFRFWDLIRRREYHEVFPTERRKRLALQPILDLTGATPAYIMVRDFSRRDDPSGNVFDRKNYYQSIPGISSASHIIQNPQY
jgi:hypothetical protein